VPIARTLEYDAVRVGAETLARQVRAAVSTRLDWDDLDGVYATRFDILNVPGRLARRGDVWQDIRQACVDLNQFLQA
jgi:DNA primase